MREAFAENFASHGDIGAAVCVYQDGVPVVDLWDGVADAETGRPWARDTLQLVYSAAKGVTATAAHLLAQRGELDLDAPVATYWPEFAANGKAEIPVRWLLSHHAGLVALDQPVTLADALAWQPMVDALAAQHPLWTPGAAHGYHGRTFGWLVGEVIRRVSGRTRAGSSPRRSPVRWAWTSSSGCRRVSATGAAGCPTSSRISTSRRSHWTRFPSSSGRSWPRCGTWKR